MRRLTPFWLVRWLALLLALQAAAATAMPCCALGGGASSQAGEAFVELAAVDGADAALPACHGHAPLTAAAVGADTGAPASPQSGLESTTAAICAACAVCAGCHGLVALPPSPADSPAAAASDAAAARDEPLRAGVTTGAPERPPKRRA